MSCFFKRCYDDEEQFKFKQCLHSARRLFDVSPQGLSDKKVEALVVECMTNVCWGCGKDDDLRTFLAKVDAAYAAEAAACSCGEGGAPNIVHICKRMLAARTVLAR